MDHIIRRQLLELTLDGRQPPFDLQNRLSDQYYQTLLPVLEKWFDQLAGEDEVLFIDRLVLDLGEFSRRDFDDRLLKQRLIEKLGSPDIARTMGMESLSADGGRGAASATGSRPGTGGGSRASRGSSVQRRSARHNAFEQWIWYMEKGYLPWSLMRVTPEWEYKVLETLATDYPAITRLRSLLTNQPATLTRIAQQHDDIFLMRLAEILTTVVQSPLPQTLQELRRLLIYAVNLETVEYQPALIIPTPEKAWKDALMLAATLGKEGATQALAQRLLLHYWAGYPKYLPELQDYLATHPIAREIVEPSAEPPPGHELSRAGAATGPFQPSGPATPGSTGTTGSPAPFKKADPLRDNQEPGHSETREASDVGAVESEGSAPSAGAKGPEGPADATPPATDRPAPLTPELRVDAPGRNTAATPPQPEGSASSGGTLRATGTPAITSPLKAIPVPPAIPSHLSIEHLPEEGLFLMNAGVILTHPFLSHLFKLSGLLVSGKFIADEARQKAIHLLHYLATGRTIAGEYELTAAKVLCGCPLEYPAEKQSVITPEELKEADSLLGGLLGHWGVKNITVEGLRANFLTRSGKLSPKNDKLQLVIEKHAVDILVRTYPFPWNMSIIKLPWLQQAIHLDW